MKKILSLIAITFALNSYSLFSQEITGIKFFEGTFAEAKLAAEKEGKQIFIDAYTTWCGPCKMMSKNVFTNAEVAEYFNANFINLKIDMEGQGGPEIKKLYRVNAYPTLLFVDYNGKLTKELIGYHDPKSLIHNAKNIK